MKLHNLNGLIKAFRWATAVSCAVLFAATTLSSLVADPCGMVLPIYTGQGSPIARTGL